MQFFYEQISITYICLTFENKWKSYSNKYVPISKYQDQNILNGNLKI